MMLLFLLALGSPSAPSCSFGDYISICNFTAPKTGDFRIAGIAEARASGSGPHRLTAEYMINGQRCTEREAWPAGRHKTSASCVVQLKAATYYHLVATTNAQNADHIGQVLINVEPSREQASLHP